MKGLRVLLCLCLAAALLAVPVLGASSVTYEGGAERFVVVPESGNLFENFQNVLPGDTLSQEITVKNSGKTQALLYLRADSAENREFLSQMQLTVLQGDTVLSKGPASEQGGLAEKTRLGTFAPGEHTVLTVHLTVPIAMGDEFQDELGKIVWIFSADETTAPKTGDVGWAVYLLLMVAMTAFGAFALLRKKGNL